MTKSEEIKLTEYSHGGGCGCKIAPAVLREILDGTEQVVDKKLLVGNHTNDDAAVLDLGNGMALISTTDFFMPIVDDAFTFGRIAAANALSDVYAMGGKPIMALSILGWPIDKLPASLAKETLEGAKSICAEANITLAGGHSVDNLEPLFGLSVNGTVKLKNLKRNVGAIPNDLLYLTKPLGTGIISSAIKRNLATEEEVELVIKQMTSLNKIGAVLGEMPYVNAMTDVTGFGLLGHLIEMMEGSNCTAELCFKQVPTLPIEILNKYIDGFVYPSNTFKNFSSYSTKVSELNKYQLPILCDPQTNGGLLIAVNPKHKSEFENRLTDESFTFCEVGKVIPKADKTVFVTA